MPNKNYIRGRAFEYRCMKHFRELGYYCVRSYASKGVFDFIAIAAKNAFDTKSIMVQCKCTKTPGYLEPVERRQLEAAAKLYNGRVLHCYNAHGKIRIEEF